MRKCLNQFSISGYVRLTTFLERHQASLLFLFGIFLFSLGTLENSQAQNAGGGITGGFEGEKFGQVCKIIVNMHSEKGSYGALLTSLSGIGAILASAMGGFKAAWGLLVVALGSFLLDSYRTLFFGEACGGPYKG